MRLRNSGEKRVSAALSTSPLMAFMSPSVLVPNPNGFSYFLKFSEPRFEVMMMIASER